VTDTDPKRVPDIRDQLREVAVAAAHVSFLERLRVNSRARTMQAYSNYVQSVVSLWRSFEDLHTAKFNFGRARRMLEDAEEVYAYDDAKRRRKRIEEEVKLADAEVNAEIAAIQRQERLRQARGEKTIDGVAEPVAEEFKEDLKVDMTADMMRKTTQEIIDDFIEKRGGKSALSETDKADIQNIRHRAEQLIKESGFGRG
jgi:hypothetical protein